MLDKTERLHSMDSLRAIMMLLGIVLHASITYIGGEPSAGWPLRDPSSSNSFLKWLLYVIHNFRMPIFMLVAGFFAALLFYDRSPRKMFVNRVKRIVWPFAIFVILLWPLVTLSFSYSNGIFGFENTPDIGIKSHLFDTTLSSFASLSAFIPQATMHLWFLYYLIFFSVASFGLGKLFAHVPKVTAWITKTFNVIIQKPVLKLIVFSLATLLLLVLMKRGWVATSTSFAPDANTFIFYFFFYMLGWVLFKSKHLLDSFKEYDRLFVAMGLAIYTAYFLADATSMAFEWKALINSCCVWLFIFGFTGLFLRYFSKHSARMRYISDSSYWVYLLHLPLTAFIPGLIGSWAIPAILKVFRSGVAHHNCLFCHLPLFCAADIHWQVFKWQKIFEKAI